MKQQIVEMTVNGSGVRNFARVLHVSTSTVIKELKKVVYLESVNQRLLNHIQPEQVEVEIFRVAELQEMGIEESELDGIWS